MASQTLNAVPFGCHHCGTPMPLNAAAKAITSPLDFLDDFFTKAENMYDQLYANLERALGVKVSLNAHIVILATPMLSTILFLTGTTTILTPLPRWLLISIAVFTYSALTLLAGFTIETVDNLKRQLILRGLCELEADALGFPGEELLGAYCLLLVAPTLYCAWHWGWTAWFLSLSALVLLAPLVLFKIHRDVGLAFGAWRKRKNLARAEEEKRAATRAHISELETSVSTLQSSLTAAQDRNAELRGQLNALQRSFTDIHDRASRQAQRSAQLARDLSAASQEVARLSASTGPAAHIECDRVAAETYEQAAHLGKALNAEREKAQQLVARIAEAEQREEAYERIHADAMSRANATVLELRTLNAQWQARYEDQARTLEIQRLATRTFSDKFQNAKDTAREVVREAGFWKEEAQEMDRCLGLMRAQVRDMVEEGRKTVQEGGELGTEKAVKKAEEEQNGEPTLEDLEQLEQELEEELDEELDELEDAKIDGAEILCVWTIAPDEFENVDLSDAREVEQQDDDEDEEWTEIASDEGRDE